MAEILYSSLMWTLSQTNLNNMALRCYILSLGIVGFLMTDLKVLKFSDLTYPICYVYLIIGASEYF